MAKKVTKDIFSNLAYGSVVETALNTLTFSEINTGVSVHERIAWIINRILWYPLVATLNEIKITTEQLDLALTAHSNVDDIAALSDPGVLTLMTLSRLADATATGSEREITPFIQNFSDLPGGGLIIAPKPLYVAAKGSNLAGPTSTHCRIYYTIKELEPDEFWELVQAARIVQ